MTAPAAVEPDRPPPLVVDGVVHAYGTRRALDGVTLAFAAGTSTAIIGPDGVGKSTLLGLVTGVRRLQTGEVAVFGGSLRTRAVRDAVARRIAYMPQGLGRNLYPTLSVRENIDFHARLFGLDADARARRIDRLLAATGLDPFPDRPAGKLSGGMKQKLSLCCALVHDPDLLVLDEPTTGVDPLSRRQFWELVGEIRAARADMTVIVATAYMEEAAGFDRVVAIDDGRVIADGAPAAIVAATGAADLEGAFAALQSGGDAAAPFVVPPRRTASEEIAIEAHGLTRRFGDFVAVDHVSFAIPRGEIFGFLGSNGCGKTTTMKMLTGLLPASAGSATLLGRPVEADDVSVRLRVGYVSQSFSLWEELTVADNLRLHARLYRVPEAEVGARVAEALARFDLVEDGDRSPAALPLGLRQRLQLAAACLHHPEVLILDEPTSGVDPQARDAFWRRLADLSRDDGVTIFVSTHFMNEAERCDRISLMHQGRVLAVGRPADLVRQAGAATLEDAFVAALLAADAETAHARHRAVAPVEAADPEGERREVGGIGRTLAFARREAIEIRRDPVRLSFAVLGSLLLLVLFAFGVSFDVEHLPFAVFDRDQSIESRRLVEAFDGGRWFRRLPAVASEAETDRRLKNGELRFVLVVPPGFGRDFLAGRRPEVAVEIDGANTFRAETVRGYVEGVALDFASKLSAELLGPSKTPTTAIRLEPRFAYNQAFRSVDAITPGVVMLLLMLIPAAMTAVGVVRERETGSFSNLQASPARIHEFLIGKQLPYVAVGMVSFATLTLTSVLFFGVPLRGSILELTLGALLYVLAATGFGLMISTLVTSQVAAIFAVAILSVIPAVNFSGFLNPVTSLEGAARFVGLGFPTSWFQTVSIGVFAKGLGFADLWREDVILAGFAVLFLAVARLLLDKQER
ncbi:MAG: ribosome-associated ATPase/putative transporter RbbA [Siculibacillus sp.]